jgi:hypothetical protein
LNQQDWSDRIMLDVNRLYPDGNKVFRYIPLGLDLYGVASWFPLTDDTGRSMGLEIRPTRPLPTDFLFTVTVPAAGQLFGVEATLEIELQRPAYVTDLVLAPFSVYPVRLRRAVFEGLTSLVSDTVFSGDVQLDRPLRLEFPRQLVRRIYLTLRQENYTWKEHLNYSASQLRRDALRVIEASLPLNFWRIGTQDPEQYIGAQYETSLESLAAEDRVNQLPSVQVLGPYYFKGCPSLVRLAADYSGDVDFYLGFRVFNSSGVEQDAQLMGVPLVPDVAQVFPFALTLDPTTVYNGEFYLKLVLRSNDALVERFLVEVL